jgi:hypothetical protein
MREKYCATCDVRFATMCDMQLHLRASHSDIYNLPDLNEDDLQIGGGEAIALTQSQSILDGGLRKYEADLTNANVHDLRGLYTILRPQIRNILRSKLAEGTHFKFNFSISVCFSKIQPDGSTQYNIPTFNTFLLSCHGPSDITFGLRKMYDSFATRIDGFTSLASGWTVRNILTFELTIVSASSYLASGEFKLPAIFLNKHSLISPPVRNDAYCFKRAIYCSDKLHNSSSNRVRRQLTQSMYLDRIMDDGRVNWSGIKFPFDVRQIERFHKNNPHLGVSIFLYDDTIEISQEGNDEESTTEDIIESDYTRNHKKDDGKIHQEIRAKTQALHICKEEREIMIDLLLIHTAEGQHYAHITHLGGLFQRPRGYLARNLCRWCLSWFSDSMDHHQKFCTALGYCKTELPNDSVLKFRHYNYTQKVPYIIICDFECSLCKLEQEAPTKPSYIHKTHVHKPNGYAYVIVDWIGNLVCLNEYKARTDDENVVKRFLAEIIAASEELKEKVKQFNHEAENTTIDITPEDEEILSNPFRRRNHPCCFCKEPLGNDTVHRHHSHLPPYEYVGLSHSRCNLHGRVKPMFTMYFHNSRKYDGLFLLRNASKDLVDNLDVIMGSSEEVVQLTINNCIKVLDSMHYFYTSLAKVAKSMDTTHDFKLVRSYFSQYAESSVNLLLKKQFYPYSYVDSVLRFSETDLPPKEAFYNDIYKEDIKDEDYAHAQQVWREFNMQTFGDYHTLYLKLDILILADAIVSLRNMIFSDFNLDLCHYISLSQLSLDAALKSTGRKLDLIQDRTMFLFCRKAALGGMSTCGNIRCHQANNKYLADYDPNKPTSHILYLDAVNMYGASLMSKLPTTTYEWCLGMELEFMQMRGAEFWKDLDDDGDVGYFAEVDLSIPEHLIQEMDKFPPIYTCQPVNYDLLSEYQKQLFEDLGLPATTFKTVRLMATFFPVKNYVVHSKLLKFWISIGVQVDKLHHAVRFKQEAWLAPYIYYMSEKRKNETTELGIDRCKRMVNLVFGKTIEDKRKRLNAKIVRTKDEIKKWAGKPTADRVIVINKSNREEEDIAIVCLRKESITLDTLVAVGSSCLGIAKCLIQDFYYNYVVRRFPAHDVLYHDTDSLILSVRNVEDVYEVMKEDGHRFDMSGYDRNHTIWGKFFNPINKKRPGYFKDEFPNCVIRRFIVIKPKMYSIEFVKEEVVDGESRRILATDCKAKGVVKVSIKKECRFDDYVKCLTENAQTYTENTAIRSDKTMLFTVDIRKTALSAFDAKRWISPCGVMTLAFGNPLIKMYEDDIEISNEGSELDGLSDSELINLLLDL